MPDQIHSKKFLLYSACFSFELKKFDLNGECIFYDSRSGETHFLNNSGLRVLSMLSESPVSLDQLLARIENPAVDLLGGRQLSEQILFLLNRFIELGIIVCASAPRNA